MESAGVIQRGDVRLARPARRFSGSPDHDATDVITQLHRAAERVMARHPFGNGMGIAAPQIGLDWAAALVRPIAGDPIVLLNPEIEHCSRDEDVKYEGCLSFFDVRGLVPRPRRLTVRHLDGAGRERTTEFADGLARLVAHEVDHLNGVLYTERMRPPDQPIPYEEYLRIREDWSYR